MTATVHDELELKFAVGRTFTVPDLTGAGAVVSVRSLPAQELHAVYYDTVDRRLARSGITLRRRSGEAPSPAWTLKLPAESEAEANRAGPQAAHRSEVEAPAEGEAVPDVLVDLVTAHIRSYPLAAAAVVTTRRGRWELQDANGQIVAELVDDDVSVMDGTEVRSRFSELELEARGASVDDLQAIADRLVEAGAVISEPIPKAVRALGPTATGQPDVIVPLCGPDDPAGMAVRASIATDVLRILRHDPGTRLGNDESLHQLRVAIRRLRSDLRTFRPLLAEEETPAMDRELQTLALSLGEVRDIDVLLSRTKKIYPDLRPALAPMLAGLRARRKEARQRLLADLRSDRYAQLLERLVVMARDPMLTPVAAQPASVALGSIARRAWRRLEKREGPILKSPESTDEELHEARIATRRARFAIESVAAQLGDPVEGQARAVVVELIELQDVLGRHQDAVVAVRETITALNEHPGHEELAYAAGRMAEREMSAARDERQRLRRTWAATRAQRPKAWKKR